MLQVKEKIGNYLYGLVYSEKDTTFSFLRSMILVLLAGLSVVYALLAGLKRSLYQYGVLKSYRLSRPVISLGNITLGGTGKTPAAKNLALFIRDQGFKVAVLNRGYRASFQGDAALVSDGEKTYLPVSECGDEAYLLAQTLPGVMVVIGKNRAVAGQFAIEKHGAEVLIIDDGYQHWRLKRDLDIVLIDTLDPFGNKYTLPRGILREPLACLDRADIFLLTKTNQSSAQKQDIICWELRKYNQTAAIVKSSHAPGSFTNLNAWLLKGGEKENTVSLDNTAVVAFSALGNPASFEQTLNSLGVKTAAFICYPDHHYYTIDEMLDLAQKAAVLNAAALVTTEKDAVKIPAAFLAATSLPVYVLPLDIVFQDGRQELYNAVSQILQNSERRV
ncbi:MAG: tetraacyldisaccharide 4'-kinase [Sporomusaceae bacterium]|jgi:tetraacyldisaccharide 4'-kinase|nr:tetraacyldisaccharide 4'-kinase [Sporomusaceae bacterium]